MARLGINLTELYKDAGQGLQPDRHAQCRAWRNHGRPILHSPMAVGMGVLEEGMLIQVAGYDGEIDAR